MFFCPECDYESDGAGRCPQCQIPLVKDTKFNANEDNDEEKSEGQEKREGNDRTFR